MRRPVTLTFTLALVLIATPGLWGQLHHSTTSELGCGCATAQAAGPCQEQTCCPRILPAIARGIHGVLNSLLPCCQCGECDDCGTPCRVDPAPCRTSYRRCLCLPLIPIISYRRGSSCESCNACDGDYGAVTEMGQSVIGTRPTPAKQPGSTLELPPDLPEKATPPESLTPPPLKGASQQGRQTRTWRNRTTRNRPRGVSQLPLASVAIKPKHYKNHTVALVTPVSLGVVEPNKPAPRHFEPVDARQLNRSQLRVLPGAQRTVSGRAIPVNPLR